MRAGEPAFGVGSDSAAPSTALDRAFPWSAPQAHRELIAFWSWWALLPDLGVPIDRWVEIATSIARVRLAPRMAGMTSRDPQWESERAHVEVFTRSALTRMLGSEATFERQAAWVAAVQILWKRLSLVMPIDWDRYARTALRRAADNGGSVFRSYALHALRIERSADLAGDVHLMELVQLATLSTQVGVGSRDYEAVQDLLARKLIQILRIRTLMEILPTAGGNPRETRVLHPAELQQITQTLGALRVADLRRRFLSALRSTENERLEERLGPFLSELGWPASTVMQGRPDAQAWWRLMSELRFKISAVNVPRLQVVRGGAWRSLSEWVQTAPPPNEILSASDRSRLSGLAQDLLQSTFGDRAVPGDPDIRTSGSSSIWARC